VGRQLTISETLVTRIVREELERDPTLPVIEFRGVSKAFGSNKVLDHVDLKVFRGEVLVILGGSGSGKSVSLRQMNGLDHPDEGRVLVDGVDISDLDEEQLGPVRRKVGMLSSTR
jgi:ABC-type transporter Mla maintaining outer membrane lipid asymmetry ATPase subunit MlaF